MHLLYRNARMLVPAVLLAALLGACGSATVGPQPTNAPQPTAEPTAAAQPTLVPNIVPELAATAAPTSAPQPVASAAPTATPQPAAAPRLYYIDQNAVFEQQAGGQPRRITELAGTPLDAAVVGDALLVLSDVGLVQVDPQDGASTTLLKFDAPAHAGSRLLATRDQKVFYAAWADDPEAVFGKTQIGYYDAQMGGVAQLITLERGAAPLGVTPKRDGLYVLPIGGDPSFGQIEVVDIASGKLRTELPVEGEGMPAVSPDGRLLVTAARRFSASDPSAKPESLLYLYDLTAKTIKPQVISPPKQSSAANYPFWSPDSSAFYFALGSGDIYSLKDSYGLWRYAIAANQTAQVSDVDVLNAFFADVNDQGAVLLRRTTQAESQLVDLATGSPTAFALPPNAIVAGWR